MTLKETIHWLDSTFPIEVEIEVKVLPNHMGLVRCVRGKYYIEIDKLLSTWYQIETLIHEWAHVLIQNGEHNDAWGIAYAKIYTAFLDWVHNDF